MVEHDLAKVGVAGSSPVSRSEREKGRKVYPYGESRFSLSFKREEKLFYFEKFAALFYLLKDARVVEW